ncbi:hypothetical protein TSOC_006593 [Tetrabaena socialis]|uniref:Methyltransferase FkbM domain-containing protein n=1 Tax=Tetrabaena socialis TaxID=47790 RepID=A0A2J8A379_9CHLO|nr:hypothetical protein TSOC_006593 [Tetrabaena socialis]|eukprot:PNH06979.1 hypothetical protein TSOC_006593 [Tetrabaena socialis]
MCGLVSRSLLCLVLLALLVSQSVGGIRLPAHGMRKLADDSLSGVETAGELAGGAKEPQPDLLTPGLPVKEVCTNSCSKARNGVCEEGRAGKVHITAPHLMVYCDLGTDCDDCGPWKTTATEVPWEDPAKVGPIRLLQSRDVQVRVRPASVPPPIAFKMAYTDPTKDFDVSYHMEGSGIVESGITEIAFKVLKDRCTRPDGSRALVVDVGANFGWFAVLAARMGCKVIAYEPVPIFRAFFEFSVHLNDLTSLIDVRAMVVSHETGKTMNMVVPARGIWGTAGIDGLNIDKAIESEKESIEVASVRLEDEVRSDVILMKADVEGWEWAVIKGATGLLKGFNVENIIMEYSPGVPERHFKYDDMAATPGMLADLIGYGYRIGHIGDAGKHLIGGWDSELISLREVSMANLKYDIEDVERWRLAKLACPSPPELAKYPMWALCGGVPEGLNPRSLRSEIGHNTNVWISKSPLLKLEGMSGIFHPDDPVTKYFQNNTLDFGMGSRPCMHLDSVVQVKHRCRCIKKEACGEEELAVQRASEEGKIVQNYVLP